MADYATYSARRKLIETPFGRIAVVEKGEGPAAVFLHGFALNGYHWRYQLDALTQTLYLKMMRTEGTGFLASAIALETLFAIPFRRGETWAC